MFITFEGKDGSGKSTHAESLASALKEKGFKVKLIHFPRYEGTIGSTIGEMLSGKRKMPNFEAFQLLCVADQLDFQSELQYLLDDDYIVIADRYDLSTIAYYASKMRISVNEAYSIVSSYQKDLIKPDLTFILDSTFEDLNKRREGMNKSCDLIENDKTIADNINDSYFSLWYMFIYHMRDVRLINTNVDIEKNKRLIKNIILEIVGD